jgi:hypothetical protein
LDAPESQATVKQLFDTARGKAGNLPSKGEGGNPGGQIGKEEEKIRERAARGRTDV